MGVGVALLLTAFVASTAASQPAPVACPGCFEPAATTEPWQIQLQGRIDTSLDASFYDVDMSVPAKVVDRLHRRGAAVGCYIDAGSWESYRPDADSYPTEVLGRRYQGYPDERWLDIRRIDLLAPIIDARLDTCRRKGFDGIDPDNLNGFENRTGFPLTRADQLRFNTWIANEAHSRGLAVGLKNDDQQARELEPYFDWVIVEQCFQQHLCGSYAAFTAAGKPIYAVEYADPSRQTCAEARRRTISLVYKRPALRAPRRVCPAP